MQILVANLGSTSFKYRLFDVNGSQARMLAKGGSERVTDYRAAIDLALSELAAAGHIREASGLDAIGFKTVLGGDITGCLLAALKKLCSTPSTSRPRTTNLTPKVSASSANVCPVSRASRCSRPPSISGYRTMRAVMPYQKLGTKPAFAATVSTAPATNLSPNVPPICSATTMSVKLSAAFILMVPAKFLALRCA